MGPARDLCDHWGSGNCELRYVVKTNNPEEASTLVSELRLEAPDAELPAEVHDCWNIIGVEGNGSCAELRKFVHCRNCPVYSAASLQLLDRPLTPEYRRQWTEHFAREKKLTEPARLTVILFRVASEWLALPARAFQEVAERRPIHSLPHRRRNVVLGLANVRGELLICVSLTQLLGLEPENAHPRQRAQRDRLLVANWNNSRFVFPVDEVFGLHRFQPGEIREAPATVAHSTHSHTQGVFTWRERTVGMLDADALFAALNRNLS